MRGATFRFLHMTVSLDSFMPPHKRLNEQRMLFISPTVYEDRIVCLGASSRYGVLEYYLHCRRDVGSSSLTDTSNTNGTCYSLVIAHFARKNKRFRYTSRCPVDVRGISFAISVSWGVLV